jgi:DNA oxidative demethylase
MLKRSSNRYQQELLPEEEQPLPAGFHYLAGYLDAATQTAVLSDVQTILADAPLFEQKMPRTGAPLSVRTSNAGDFGWVTDREKGYRYQQTHPVTGVRWPEIPSRLLKIWTDTTREKQAANLCLVNFYGPGARLGLHQDKGDASLAAPVLSISLGDDAVFSFGTESRRSSLRRLELRSGDVIWFGDQSRLIYHSVERIRPGTSNLLKDAGFPVGGRINITLRRIERTLLVRESYRNAELFRD